MELKIFIRRLIAGIGIILLLTVFIVTSESGRLLLYASSILCALIPHFAVYGGKEEPEQKQKPLQMKTKFDPLDTPPILPPQYRIPPVQPVWKAPARTFEEAIEEPEEEETERQLPSKLKQKVGKFCEECGHKNKKTAKFCASCGMELS